MIKMDYDKQFLDDQFYFISVMYFVLIHRESVLLLEIILCCQCFEFQVFTCSEEPACGKGLRLEFKITQLGQQMVGGLDGQSS